MKSKIISVFAILVLFAFGCNKSNIATPAAPPVVPPIVPVVVTPLTTLPVGWKVATSFMNNFPQGIQLFSFDSMYNGRKVKAFCLAYDSRNTAFECKPVMSATAKTPSAFASSETGVTYASINAGYYGGGQSYSLIKFNNTVSSPNIRVLNRTYNGASTPYYPTRAAFGFSNTGVPSVAWIYNVGATNNLIYSYPNPSPNLINTAPQVQPTETFPTGGSVWDVTTAVGGSPVLIKNNVIRISDAEELIDINNTTQRPRSAIGYMANGLVLIFAIEGDNLPDYAGINLADFASLIKTFNCAEAINLDGGGSTSLVVNNSLTVRPGDNGVERPVISALLIKKR